MGRQFMKLPCDILARTDLRMTAKVVYAVLWDAMRGPGSARLGYHAIAKRAGVGRTAVVAAVDELARRTDLVVERGHGAGKANTYSFALECGPECEPPGGAESDPPPIRNPTAPHPESDRPPSGLRTTTRAESGLLSE